MNAAEARKATEQNLEELAETQLNDVISELSRLIKEETAKGNSYVSIFVNEQSALCKLGWDERIIEHFKFLGYGVERIRWRTKVITFRVYWF